MRSLPSFGLALMISVGAPAVVLAQDQTASAGDIALARSLGLEGVQLADAGNCAAAIDKLQRAEALYHAPTMLVRLGECQVATGKVVMGTESLLRVVREALPPKAPKAFADAQVRAQKALDAALPKVAKLRIHVETPPGVRPMVKLDGEPLSLAALDVDRPADPGPHQIEASAPGFKTAKAETTLQEGATGAATLRLEQDATASAPPPGTVPYAPPPGAPPGAPPPESYGSPPPMGVPPPEAPEPKGSSKALGIVLLSVGGAGIAVGTVWGIAALNQRADLDNVCNPKANCDPLVQPQIDSLHTYATVSTVGFAVGIVGVGAGIIALVASKAPASAEVKTASASVTPFVGPRSIGLSGSF